MVYLLSLLRDEEELFSKSNPIFDLDDLLFITEFSSSSSKIWSIFENWRTLIILSRKSG